MKKRVSIAMYIVLMFVLSLSFPKTSRAETIQLGKYPQSKVEDIDLHRKLNKLKRDSNSEVTYQGEKYRRVLLWGWCDTWYKYEPINWSVMDAGEDEVYLMSELILDGKDWKKNAWCVDLRWTDSDVREWLNTTFYDATFTKSEKSCIYLTTLETIINDNDKEVTKDKVFCPSKEELIKYGFNSNDSRIAKGTQYYGGNEYYIRILRDYCGYDFPGFVNSKGEMYKNVPNYGRGIRPCIKVNYSAAKKMGGQNVKRKDFTKASVTLSETSYVFNYKSQEPKVTVKYNGKKLVRHKDYSVVYKDNYSVGTASVIVTGMGEYSGTITKTFEIKSNKGTNEKNTYTITYDYKGGTKIGEKDNPESYNSNQTITLAAPGKTGYIFIGWYTDSKLTKKISRIKKGATGNLKLYAKWKPIVYHITYNKNGATNGSMTKDMNVAYDKKIKLKSNKFKRTGYSFAGWSTTKKGKVQYKNNQEVSNLSYKNNETVNLYAKWNLKHYTIKYVSIPENLNVDWKTNKIDYTVEDAFSLSKPECEGYIFKGWYTDKAGKRAANISTEKGSTGEKVFYAKFTPIKYTIEFNGNNVINDVPAKLKCVYGKNYTLPGSSVEGFDGWNTAADGNGVAYQAGQSVKNLSIRNEEIITLYAFQTEEAWFPMQTMSLSQIAYESYSHKQYNAIDICGSTYMFAPFTGRIVSFSRHYGKVIFVSENKVKYADGRRDYMSILLLHASNLDELQKLYEENTLIKQGTLFYRQGRTGQGGIEDLRYGIHVEVRVAQGIKKVDFPGDVYAFDAFYVNPKKTTQFYNKGLLENGNYMTREDAPSNWNDLWRFLP